MATNPTGAGSSVELSKFRFSGKDNSIGHKIKIIKDKQLVTKVWCKLCAKQSKAIQSHPTCKGPARKAMLAYVNGTSYVAKCKIMRHLSGKAHSIINWAEQGTKSEDASLETISLANQTKITTSMDNAAKEAH